MAQIDNRYAQAGSARTDVVVDEGLRAYMLRVYNYMAGGVLLTGIVAYLTFSAAVVERTGPGRRGLTEFGQLIYTSPLKWVIMLSPLAFVFFLSFRVNKMSLGAAQISFWAFAAVMGLSLSSIFLVFTGQSITQVFFVTAIAFGGLSLYGYTTKKDLSGWGSFLIMGVIGIIAASLVNLFLQSSALQFAISVIGVLVFAGLTAYDTQRIKDGYFEVMNDATLAGKAAIMGALSLYLDFINMFTMLLQLFGNRE
jgi:FtsH-binding integral membrane protein